MLERSIFKVLGTIVAFYVALCALMYIQQESMVIHPEKLPQDLELATGEEMKIKALDGALLCGMLFHADTAKDLIFACTETLVPYARGAAWRCFI